MTNTTRARLQEAIKALKPWLKHPDDCGATKPPYTYCSCGLNYAYQSALAACLAAEGEEAERENERAAFERLSLALTGGAAATWDEVFHAADALAAVAAEGEEEPQ